MAHKRTKTSAAIGLALATIMCVFAFVFVFGSKEVDAADTKLTPDANGVWHYSVNNVEDHDYVGLAFDENVGWWYVENGIINFDYNGLVEFGGTWWCVADGHVAFDYTGLWSDPTVGWWYVENGTINFGYDGIINYEGSWWCVAGGRVVFDYTGLWSDPTVGWWYIEDGTVNFEYNGIIPFNGGWWCVAGGSVVFDYTGLWSDPTVGWWYIENGMVNFNHSGLVQYGEWWCVNNGGVDFGYTGLWNDAVVGIWYVENGSINFGYNGQATYNGKKYTVSNGQATPVSTKPEQPTKPEKPSTSDNTFALGAKESGDIADGGLYVIQSAANENMALTAVKDSSATGYNVVMAPIDGSNAQKFLIYKQADGSYILLNQMYKDEDGNGYLLNALHFGWNDSAVDNVSATPNSISGCKNWYINEVGSGTYEFIVPRTDDFKPALNAEGTSKGANVGTAKYTGDNTQKFYLRNPYTKTVDEGEFTVQLSDDNNLVMAAENASVKDSALVRAAKYNAGSEQIYKLECADADKGLYLIKNVNSQRVLEMDGTWTSGTKVFQNVPNGYPSQYWYVQKNNDGTVTFVSAHSYQYLTVTDTKEGATFVQSTGTDSASQRFKLVERKEEAAADVLTGTYVIGKRNVRFQYIGRGVYSLMDVDAKKYLAVSGNDLQLVNNDDTLARRWTVEGSAKKGYVIKSAASTRYLAQNGSISSKKQTIKLTEAKMNDYTKKYDLGFMADSLGEDVQIIRRAVNLGIDWKQYMNPADSMAEVEKRVNSAIKPAGSVVLYKGDDEDDLNKFMKNHTGKTIKLTKDIKVNNKGTGNQGTIMIPSNVHLDGDGHSFVIEQGGKVPNVAVAFFYFDESGVQHISNNAGISNVKIAYAANTQICTFGADNIYIANNELSNAVLNPIAIMSHEGDVSHNVKVEGNTTRNSGSDGIAVYGDQYDIIIQNNKVSEVYGRAGIMVSCFADGVLGRVDSIAKGPHDVIVKNNDVSKCYGDRSVSGEGIYCLGTYMVYVVGNNIYDNALEGVCFDNGCVGNAFIGNKVHNNGTVGGFPGVSIDNGAYNIVDNNEVYNNSCDGIKLVRTGVANVIVNNRVYNNDTNTKDGKSGKILSSAAINLQNLKPDPTDFDHLDGTGSDYNYIVGNTITGHDHAVYIADDSEQGVVVGNVACYNTAKNVKSFVNVDFSSGNNVVKNNSYK